MEVNAGDEQRFKKLGEVLLELPSPTVRAVRPEVRPSTPASGEKTQRPDFATPTPRPETEPQTLTCSHRHAPGASNRV